MIVFSFLFQLLADKEVLFYGYPLAVVVAGTTLCTVVADKNFKSLSWQSAHACRYGQHKTLVIHRAFLLSQ